MGISDLTIAVLALNTLLGLALPIGLLLILRKKTGCSVMPFFAGCVTFVLFVVVLESFVHSLVLTGPFGQKIWETPWLYALYGGLAAGLFEETGRLMAMKLLIKKAPRPAVSLMYGAGHGGIEVMIVMLPTMITYLVYAILLNTGNGAVLTSGMDAATIETVQTTMQSVAALPAWQLLISPVERIAAVIAHLSFSVIVWFAVKNHRAAYLLLAIVLHALLDAVTVILNYSLGSILIVECGAWVIALCIAVIARRIWKQNICAAVDMG